MKSTLRVFFMTSLSIDLAVRLAAICTLSGFLTACALSGGVAGSSLQQQGTIKRAKVLFTMHWASPSSLIMKRHRDYVPATARSVSVSVNGGRAEYLNAPATTLAVDAAVGTDVFAFTTYDEQNGQGNQLSRASVTQYIIAGIANTVNAVLNGVIASLSISIANPNPPAGSAASEVLSITAFDADGNVIVGPDDYSTAIKLSIGDPANSGTLSLSTTAISTPGVPATLSYNGGTLMTASVTVAATGVASQSATFAPRPTVYEYSLPTAGNLPQWIAAGPDGNMWFTENPGNAIANITPTGVVTQFSVPTAGANPQGIIAGSNGQLWFTEFNTSKIGEVSTGGAFQEFKTSFGADGPLLLVDRGDGNAWFTGFGGNHVSFQSESSAAAAGIAVPTANSKPYGIATAPDNNIYFSESATDKIGRLANVSGPITEKALIVGSTPEGMVRGPDGNVWFTEAGTSKIAKLVPSSFTVTAEYPTLVPNAQPVGITIGADGALWFTEAGADRIGRVTTAGVVSEYPTPTTGLGLKGIAAGPDGSIWFCESLAGRIGRLVY